jgi:hypothetical protein
MIDIDVSFYVDGRNVKIEYRRTIPIGCRP